MKTRSGDRAGWAMALPSGDDSGGRWVSTWFDSLSLVLRVSPERGRGRARHDGVIASTAYRLLKF